MNQKHCRGCQHLDFNEMSDEMYCNLKDYELIRLRWHKQRPDWCPLVMQKGEPMDDLISRKAAITTAVRAAVDWHKLANPQYSIAYCIGEAMRQLPPAQPAQPEIIYCKDCKYYEADITANPWGVCCHKDWTANNVGHDVDEDGWCYRAERREVTT